MKVVLIRHSKTSPTGKIPTPLWSLTKKGVRKAKNLSKKNIIKDVDVFYSSLETKALETALLLAKPNAIPIKTNPNLKEVTSFTNKFFSEKKYQENVRMFYKGEVERIAGGETRKEALARFEKAVGEILEEESRKESVGIVSHGNILSFFSAKFCDKEPFEIHKMIKMPDAAVLDWNKKEFTIFYNKLV